MPAVEDADNDLSDSNEETPLSPYGSMRRDENRVFDEATIDEEDNDRGFDKDEQYHDDSDGEITVTVVNDLYEKPEEVPSTVSAKRPSKWTKMKNISNVTSRLQTISPTRTRDVKLMSRIETQISDSERRALISKLFDRYDFDRSGTLNDPQELEDLTVNCVMGFKLSIELDPVKNECQKVIDAFSDASTDSDRCAEESSCHLNWTVEEFSAWFQNRIVPLDHFKETVKGSAYAFLEAEASVAQRITKNWKKVGTLNATEFCEKKLRDLYWKNEKSMDVRRRSESATPEPEEDQTAAAVSVIIANKNMMHEHTGVKGMVADIPSLRERRIKYSECMQAVEQMHSASQENGCVSMCNAIFRKLKDLSSARWNEFPLLLAQLRHIEGNFGSGVGSYFRFLRWVLLLNLNCALIWFGFVVLPWIMDPPSGNPFSSLTPGALLTGLGLEHTWFFYGGYPAVRTLTAIGSSYDMAFAYTIAVLGMFVVSLIAIIDRFFVERSVTGADITPAKFSTTLFQQLDLTVTSGSTQKVLSKGYANQIRIHIADEFATHARKKKTATWTDTAVFVLRRCAGAFITLATFALALFLISVVVQYDKEIDERFPFGTVLLLMIVKQALPQFLNIAVSVEAHDSIEQILLHSVFRIYVYKMFNLFITFWELFSKDKAGAFKTDCEETEVAQIFYNLILVDMFVVAATVVFGSTAQLQWNKYSKMKPPQIEFNHELVGGNVIDLMYRQGLIWCGAVLSPVLCLEGWLMNFIIFYVQMRCFLVTHRPPEKAWGASDSNKVFLILLLMTLAVCALPAAAFMEREIHCGPFDGKENPMSSLSEFIARIPDLKEAVSQVLNPILLLGIIVVLIIFLRLKGTDVQQLRRRLNQTNEEWTREKDEKETLMRRCLEAGMSKEELDQGHQKKDVHKEMDSDEES